MNIVFSRDDYINKAKELEHSKEFIDEILAYRDTLVSKNLPVIFSKKHFAELIGISHKELAKIIKRTQNQYNNFRIRKKLGGHREIMAPNDNLKYIQRWIKDNILENIDVSEACKGFTKGESIKTNAEVHKGKQIILKVDLLKFFDTINQNRVYGMFKSFGYSNNLAFDLAKLTTVEPSNLYLNSIRNLAKEIEICYNIRNDEIKLYLLSEGISLEDFRARINTKGVITHFNKSNIIKFAINDNDFTMHKIFMHKSFIEDEFPILKDGQIRIKTINSEILPLNKGSLPQGAPTSPYIANILAKKMDIRFTALAKKMGWSYSRYADDLTFSSDEEIPSINTIEKIILQEGFIINKNKTKVQKRGASQRVTGLTVTNGVHVPKRYKKDVWYHLHYCELCGVSAHIKKNKIEKSHFKDWLYGRICYIYSIEQHVGKKMMDSFNKIDWII